MPFIANTDAQRLEMLRAVGANSLDDLFEDIPPTHRIPGLRLPPGQSEQEVTDHLRRLGGLNARNLSCFLGGGYYDHFIPACVDELSGRGEFYTAYTPYQPEASQGTLQAIFEYQSLICRLTDMEVANASLYDGGTALYEAAMMAVRITGRQTVVVDDGVNPIHRNMLRSHTSNLPITIREIETAQYRSQRDRLIEAVDEQTAALVLQNPNFFGTVDDVSDLVEEARSRGCLVIVAVYPLSLGLLKTPGAMGADIVIGEGQSLGLPLSFGGPYLGFLAAKQAHVRRMPGRLVGETTDAQGRRGFVLTLQAREQHIRREKAMSNICTNQALCALRATIYLAWMGRQGLRDVAHLCAQKAAYARSRLSSIPGITVQSDVPIFNEFVIGLPCDADAAVGRLLGKGIAAGIPLGRYYPGQENHLLVAFTEKRTREQIEQLVTALESVL